MTKDEHPLTGFFAYEADVRAGRDPSRHLKTPSYQEAIADPDKILEFKSTAGLRFGSWSQFFNDDSVAHPAKMNLMMLEWIIDNYSEKGNIIMDMFAGTGSTLIMASRKGRNAIGVELEQHFIDTMIVPNVKASQSQTLLSGEPGNIIIVKGDSRRLDLLIPQAIDAIVSSPPYSGMDIKTHQDPEKIKEKFQRAKAARGEISESAIGTEHGKLGRSLIGGSEYTDPNNIGSLAHGSVDAVITSPPYSEMLVFSGDGKDRTKFFMQQIKEKGYIEHDGKKYTEKEWRAMAHGRIDGRTIKGIDLGEKGYSEDPDNIGNLKHGEVDSIITSPPYGTKAFADKQWMIDNMPKIEQRIREGKTKGNPRSPAAEIKHLEKIKDIEHPNSIDNIDNYGQVDTIVSSPPYSEALSVKAGGGSKDVLEGKGIKGRGKSSVPIPYSEGEDNIGNLKHGQVDAVFSSPPYGKMEMSKKFKSEEEKLAWAEKQSLINGRSVKAVLANLDRWKDWGDDTDNLGNMEHGNIDTVISSPPYGAMLSKRSGGDDRPEAMRRVMEEDWGYSPKMVDKILAGETNVGAYVTRRGYNYSGDDANIGNLPTGDIDSVISSPPYEGSLEDRGGTQQKFKEEKGTPAPYSSDPENLGNKTGETYLEAMFKVYLGCWLVMKEGGTMVIVVKNFVRKGKPVRLDLDTIKLCEAAGFELADRWWFRLPIRSFWTIQHTKKWSESHPDAEEHPYAIFEDILCFIRKTPTKLEKQKKLPDHFNCPKCNHPCGEETIYSCSRLQCPKCGTVFEPEED